MSYQFEDDSALEELLNQQLDRKKQEPLGRVSQRASTAIGKSQQQQQQADGSGHSLRQSNVTLSRQANNIDTLDYDTKSTSNLVVQNVNKSQAVSKMSAWLNDKTGVKVTESTNELDNIDSMRKSDMKTTLNRAPLNQHLEQQQQVNLIDPTFSLATITSQKEEINRLLNESLQENKLQEMSKQRLIQLILQQICPNFERMMKLLDEQSSNEVDKLRNDLRLEKNRVLSLEIQLSQEIDLAQNRWLQLKKQMDSQIEVTERELTETINKQRDIIDKLEEEHKEQLMKISGAYKSRLNEEKESFEAALKRREDFHNLELESKLKVNFEFNKLETTFKHWQSMIQSTVNGFDGQFKTIESLLEKQTIEINGTNSELFKKTKLLCQSYDNFDKQNKELQILTQELSKIMPSFINFKQENESICKQTNDQLKQFIKRNDSIKEKELELERVKNEILSSKEKLNQDKYQLGIESCKLACKEEQLNGLVKRNKEIGFELDERKKKFYERETKLDSLQSNLELKTKQIKEQNYELHLARKNFTQKQEELIESQVEISSKRKMINDQLVEVRSEANKLANLRGKAQKELNQLKRLQKSLICSICLDRLFFNNNDVKKQPINSNKPLESIELNNNGSNNDWQTNIVLKQLLNNDKTNTCEKSTKTKSHLLESSKLKTNNPFHQTNETSDSELDISKLNQQLELDAKQQEMENKYVAMLKMI